MAYDPSLSNEDRQKELDAKLHQLSLEQQERLAEHRAQEFGMPYVSLVLFPIDPDVLETVPKSMAAKASATMFYKQGRDVRVGVVNPKHEGVAEFIEFVRNETGYDPQVYVISHRSLESSLARYRREKTLEEVPEGEIRIDDEKTKELAKGLHSLEDLGKHITTLQPTEILNSIVVNAVNMGSSDIHIEPKEHDARLRFRIDGVLQDVTNFDRQGWQLILSRVKVLSQMKLNVRDTPQDGSFVLKIGENTYDIRVSVLPGGYGENIVMRILDRKSEVISITDLGMKDRDYKLVQRELKKANGMILVTGPTGSGKTTTLAAFLMTVNEPGLKVVTLEDPIEYRLPGVQQTQVDPDAGLTFAKGLRSILRQDPDIVLVGEMRDKETAETAIHAALTGHLVFSTLHTNDAPGSIPRLVDLGVNPFSMAPALNMIIAQRLVRKVCTQCAQEYAPTTEEKERVLTAMQGVHPDIFQPKMIQGSQVRFVRAQGCEACGQSGYRGRIGIYEIFGVQDKIEELVFKGSNVNEIRDAALEQGMTTLAQDGYLKVISKMTTIDEVERVTQE